MAKLLLTCTILLTLLSSCFSHQIVTPPGKKVRLATENMECKLTTEKRSWYLLWGGVPLGDTATTELLTDANHAVKIESVHTVTDVLLMIPTMFVSAVPKTIRIYECKDK